MIESGWLSRLTFLRKSCLFWRGDIAESALQDLEDLVQIKWEIAESVRIYSLAMKLSTLLQHHMFDTLYHATSLLTKGATLVTADDRYYAKAKGQGSIVRLSDFALPGMTGEAPLH